MSFLCFAGHVGAICPARGPREVREFAATGGDRAEAFGVHRRAGMSDVLLPGLQAKGGSIAGRYRVERVLGTGPSAHVVLARHTILRERVTLKIFARRTDLRAAHAAAQVESPFVARVIDTGFTEDGMPFVAYEHVAGEVLASLGRLPLALEEAAACMMQVSTGLAAAHARGLVHGNLKPSNVLRAEDGTMRILDFGARPLEDTTWRSSPAYTAPEQIADPSSPTPAADAWAVGVLLSWLLTGEVPFRADTVAGMLVAVTFDPPRIARGPAADLIARCLAKDPTQRPSIKEIERALARFTNAPVRSTLVGLSPAPRPIADAAPDVPAERKATREPPPMRASPWSLKLAEWSRDLSRDRRVVIGGAASLLVAASLLLPVDETPASTRALVEPPPWEPPNRDPLPVRPVVPATFTLARRP
jgi:eukaryotic-like serine/threonine-protein kinase